MLKHAGTALAGWTGINVAHSQGMSVPLLDWKSLGILIVSAGLIPGIGSFLQRTPLPEIEEIKETTVVTKTKETTIPVKTDELKP